MHKNIEISLLFKSGLFINAKCLIIQSCLKMRFSISVDIAWYDEVTIYAKTFFPSHSIVSWWSFANDTGEVVQQNWQSVTVWKLNAVKNAIMQVTYFLNGAMLNLLFYCHIIERKWLLTINLAIILPSKSNLTRKF